MSEDRNFKTVVLDNEEIGKRLKELRETAKLSQEKLAEKLCRNRVSILRYEKGKDTISLDVLNDYRNEFHVSADYILYGSQLADEERDLISEIDAILAKYRCK